MNPVLKNTSYYATPRRQFSNLINNSDLRETDLHETSKRATFIEQTLVFSEAATKCVL